MEETTTYPFAEEALKEARQRALLLQICLPALFALFIFFSPSKPSGKIAYIQVRSVSNKNLILHGFEGMDQIAQHLEQQVSDQSLFRRKRQTGRLREAREGVLPGSRWLSVFLCSYLQRLWQLL